MNRRLFLTTLFVTPVVAAIKPPIPWVHKPSSKEIQAIWQLQEAMNHYNNQVNEALFSNIGIPPSLMGIPYHQSDGTTGTWLGIERK